MAQLAQKADLLKETGVSVDDEAVEDVREDWDDSLTATQIAQRAFLVVGIALVS